MQPLIHDVQFEQAQYYDSRGIIPGPGEELQPYLKRASIYFDRLQRFYDDIQGKKASIKSAWNGLEGILSNGYYTLLDNVPMTEYGFLELNYSHAVIDDDDFKNIFEENKLRPIQGHSAFSINVRFDGIYLPLTIIKHSSVKDYLNIQGIDRSKFEEDMDPFDYLMKFKIPETSKDTLIKHENIHSIRGKPFLYDSGQFGEIVALSTQQDESNYWKTHLELREILEKVSWRHPLQRLAYIMSDGERKYLLEKVENGVADQFPLPLLVRIGFEEFKDIAKKIEAGDELGTILGKKSDQQSLEYWRWKFISELCELDSQ